MKLVYAKLTSPNAIAENPISHFSFIFSVEVKNETKVFDKFLYLDRNIFHNKLIK